MISKIKDTHAEYVKAYQAATKKISEEQKKHYQQGIAKTFKQFEMRTAQLLRLHGQRQKVHETLVLKYWEFFGEYLGIFARDESAIDYFTLDEQDGSIELVSILDDSKKIIAEGIEKCFERQLSDDLACYKNLNEIMVTHKGKHITMKCLKCLPAIGEDAKVYASLSARKYYMLMKMIVKFCSGDKGIANNYQRITGYLPKRNHIHIGYGYSLEEGYPIQKITFFANNKQKLSFVDENAKNAFLEQFGNWFNIK